MSMSQPTETSPLLTPEANGSSSTPQPDTLTTFPTLVPASEHFKRPIKILAHVLLLGGIIDLVLIIATDIIANYGPYYKIDHETTQGLEVLGVMIVLSLILTLSHLKLHLPNLLSLILDVLLAFYILGYTSVMLGPAWPDYGWCGAGGGYQPYPPPVIPEDCDAWKIALKVLVSVIVGFGAVVGISHLILFVLRVVAGFRTKFWRRPLGLYFPTGELTVSFSIKVLKQQPPIEEAPPARPAVGIDVA